MPAILHGPSDSDFVRLASTLVIALIVVLQNTNRVEIFAAAGGREAVPLMTKDQVADRILDRARDLVKERR